MGHDVVIIGGGPGGYACAIRCAQLGLQTALVEEEKVGGVCLNWGCIPTKALIAATELLHSASTASEMGLRFGTPEIDLDALADWKTRTVETLTDGVRVLLEKNGAEIVEARGRLRDPQTVDLSTGDSLTADHIVLATGSSPIEIPSFPFTESAIWTSTDALELEMIPQHLVVIGGGVIGLELATIYRRLGSDVSVVELLPEILATVDLDRRVVSTLRRSLKEAGIAIHKDVRAEGFRPADGGLQVVLSEGDPLPCDRVLVAVGRRPRTADLGLDAAGVELDDRGRIRVDDRLRTTAESVYAIGDVAPGPMLAHKASSEGVALAECLAGNREITASLAIPEEQIPQAIFTDPEVASVGISQRAAGEAQQSVLVGRFPFAALGKALGMRKPSGFFQIVADAADHRVLGVQIIGAGASDLIAEAALAVREGLSLEALADTVHAHPTLPEGMKEAAENALGRAIHIVNR